MKCLIILDTIANAGTENSYLQLLPKLSEDIEITVVYFYADHSLLGSFRKKGIRTRFLDIQGKYGFITGTKMLLSLIKEVQPDLLISSLMRSNLISRMAALISGVQLVGTLVNDSYNPIRLQEYEGKDYWKFKAFWLLDRWTSSIPKYWISNANCLISSHVKTLGIDKSKAEVVYRGRELPAKSFLFTGSINHFVGYGRLIKRKGWLDLLEAFALVLHKNPVCTLTIFGEGPLRKTLESRVQDLGLSHSVFLPGNVPQAQEKLYDYDCFVFPSWYEGFSGALVEAMMVGMPIIASDIPMNLEAITTGIHALTFPVRDIQALASQMNYAIAHPAKMEVLGLAAKKEAVERFDIDRIAKEFEAVLRKVVTPRGLL